MSELHRIRELAKQALTIPTPTNESDYRLWGRAQRLVRNVEHICELPDLAQGNLQIDRFCLVTATYFSDAGLGAHLKTGNSTAVAEISNSNSNGENLLESAMKVVSEKLAGVVEATRIEMINRIIAESGDHHTKRVEAAILSDARNLDDMGAVGIFSEFRRCAMRGKSIPEVLQSWKKKTDYQYWQARLKESFRFESVRKLAEQRLAAAEQFMNQLKTEDAAGDLLTSAGEPLESQV